MNSLEAQFPRLKLFCQMNWEEVTKEYETHYLDVSFPEYLQQKAQEGDCPDYLYELAYFEMALSQVKSHHLTYPYLPGVYLNPSALFLSLEYDIPAMLSTLDSGPELIEKDLYLCLYQDTQGQACVHEVTHKDLQILQILENGPALSYQVFEGYNLERLEQLSAQDIVLDLLK